MDNFFTRSIFILVLLFMGNAFTLAQDDSQGQLWFCWEATVNPAHLDEFMDLQLELRKSDLKEVGFSYPIRAWTDGLFHYYFFYPVDTYNDKDAIYSELGKAIELQGNDWLNRMFSTLDNHTTWFIRWDPELSYSPENSRLNSGEGVYCIWDMFYIDPGKEQEVRDLQKGFITILKDKGYDDAVDIYIGELGLDGYFYMGVIFGKSPADLWTQNDKMWELLGDEGGQLFKEMRKYLKKRDFKKFWYLEKLSYSPEE